ncbi:MAG: HAD family hydrolase [Sphingomonadaceae bacterium]|nr:HAD family hydrolase [Sphingomonadaceae bacterium]
MSRPLLITDCDEVLLHMVTHFSAWLDEAHGVEFAIHQEDWSDALTRRETGAVVPSKEVWPLLNSFFRTEMHRQTLVPGAGKALARLGARADIVVLTNLIEEHQEGRMAQLEALGITHRVEVNQGGKGAPVRALVDEFKPSVAVFVDDLSFHHTSVAKEAPEVWRLHMIAEPIVAAMRPKAPDAHVRLDDWSEAADWIAARFAEGRGADA